MFGRQRRRSILFWVMLVAGLSCSDGQPDVPPGTPPGPDVVDLVIRNKSQFEIVHIILHPANRNYKGYDPCNTDPVPPGEEATCTALRLPQMVTVARLNAGNGSLRAYTTYRTITPSNLLALEYLDDFFRLEDISAE